MSNIGDVAKGTLCHLTGDSFLLLPFVLILPIDTREIEIFFSNKVTDIYSSSMESFLLLNGNIRNTWSQYYILNFNNILGLIIMSRVAQLPSPHMIAVANI